MAQTSVRRFLLLAQLPPPVHGVTAITARVRDVVSRSNRWRIEHVWLGGSTSLQDVNRRTLRKYLAFGSLLIDLISRRWRRVPADVSYVTFAPWTHAALRDALLAGAAKGISGRALVHLHGEGLDNIIEASSLKARLIRRLLTGTELITCTSRAAEVACRSRLFANVTLLPNTVPEPGPNSKPRGRTDKLRVGYFSNLDPRKGALRFLDAVAAAQREKIAIEAVIAGPSTPFLSKEQILASVADLGLTGVVTVEDGKYGERKDAFLGSLDVLLYPSLHDHAPLVVIEALSHGVVPIVMDTGGVREIVGHGLADNVFGTLNQQERFEAFVVRHLNRYATDRQSLEVDQGRARARYLETYTEADFARRCLALLEAAPTLACNTAVLRHLAS